jgi:hypothetical protein
MHLLSMESLWAALASFLYFLPSSNHSPNRAFRDSVLVYHAYWEQNSRMLDSLACPLLAVRDMESLHSMYLGTGNCVARSACGQALVWRLLP